MDRYMTDAVDGDVPETFIVRLASMLGLHQDEMRTISRCIAFLIESVKAATGRQWLADRC
jgi:hypothetical protein